MTNLFSPFILPHIQGEAADKTGDTKQKNR